jgi:5-methylthioribose kinase
MQQIIDAIENQGSAEDFAAIPVPETYRGITVHRDEAEMFADMPTRDKDPRRSLHLDDVPVPELAAGVSERFIGAWLAELWSDALGYAGCEMIRRIIGISHVEDFEWIEDVGVRAACEARALHLARRLLLERHRFAIPQAVTAAARISPA